MNIIKDKQFRNTVTITVYGKIYYNLIDVLVNLDYKVDNQSIKQIIDDYCKDKILVKDYLYSNEKTLFIPRLVVDDLVRSSHCPKAYPYKHLLCDKNDKKGAESNKVFVTKCAKSIIIDKNIDDKTLDEVLHDILD